MNRPEREDTRLAQTLQSLAEMEAAVEAPSRLEAAVMARWDSRRSGVNTDRSRAGRVVRGTAATAAGITLVGALAWPRTNPPVEAPAGPAVSATATGYRTVAVVGGPLMAGEPLRVVRMRVARAALGDLGMASPARPGSAQAETVDIDVLVGEDGVARGVRVPIGEL